MPPLLPTLDEDAGLRGQGAQVTIESVTRMLRLLRGIALFMPLFALPVVYAYWDSIPRPWMLAWWVFVTLVPIAQFIHSRRFLSRPSDLTRALRYGRFTTVISALRGVAWGCAGLMLVNAQSVGQQVLLLGLIVGIPSGSIFGCAYWPATQYAASSTAVILTIIGFVLQGTPSGFGLSVALLIYLPVLWILTEQAHRTAMESIRLHFENATLVAQLEVEKAIAVQANIAKSKFLAAASHDLRQPLHSVGLFVGALQRRVHQAETKTLVRNIQESLTALEGLFNALLDVSRLDAGVVEPEVQHVDLARLVARLSGEFEPQAVGKGLSWRASGPALAVRSDPVLLETILRNLLSNALRYTPSGGIVVQWRIEGAQVCIDVTDSGIGIARKHHQEIFAEFTQLHNPERDRTKGLGLGLSIVSRLVHLLSHDLQLRSAPEEGSTFSLLLPLGDLHAVREFSSGAATAVDAPLQVLVIDDEASVREAMQVLLEDWGHEVVAAGSLDQALAALTRAPDVIIADYRLRDDVTGVEAIRALHCHFVHAAPALIVTGDTHPDRIAQAQASGFALLHKPVSPAKLRAFLRGAGRARVTRPTL